MGRGEREEAATIGQPSVVREPSLLNLQVSQKLTPLDSEAIRQLIEEQIIF